MIGADNGIFDVDSSAQRAPERLLPTVDMRSTRRQTFIMYSMNNGEERADEDAERSTRHISMANGKSTFCGVMCQHCRRAANAA